MCTLGFNCTNPQSFFQTEPLLYYANNLNHVIMLNTHTHTHTRACTHTHMHTYRHMHIQTVSMETGSRAFYDWLFAQDNQKWSQQPYVKIDKSFVCNRII